MILSTRVSLLTESQSMQMNARSQTLRAQGVDIVNMSLGEPDFATPEAVKTAAREAVDADYSHYGAVPGLLSLREAIAQSLHYAVSYAPSDIIVSVGAKQCIYNTVQCLINPGDEVVAPTPCWLSYSAIVRLAGGVFVPVKTEAVRGYKMTAAQLERAITDKTKLLILCSPNNPTGTVYSRDELQALVEVLVRHPQVFVISDEIYAAVNYVGGVTSMAEFPEIADRLVIVNGVSKAYAMTGYRIGWMACRNSELIAGCIKLQGQEITCATMVAQKAAEAAYRGSQECVEHFRAVFEQRRDLIVSLANNIPDISFPHPEGAFYLFPDVSAYYGRSAVVNGKRYDIQGSTDMANYLLEVGHVALVMGAAFGEDRCIRLSYATDEATIRKALTRIAETLHRLK